uniref:Metalloendopeptidase n=1 Tax=Ascaris lumbricoides TaxID=6252 RepID=A0A9J2PA38_ASCLU
MQFSQMLGEVTRYSDVHHQRDQDYGSVQKLMHAFFHALAGESDDAPLISLPHYSSTRVIYALATQISTSANSHFQPRLEPIYDGTETGRNRPVSRDLFESDIVLTVDQLKGIVLAEKERRTGRKEHRRHRRKVITGSVYRWNKNQPIPYEFKSDDGKVTFPGSLCDIDSFVSIHNDFRCFPSLVLTSLMVGLKCLKFKKVGGMSLDQPLTSGNRRLVCGGWKMESAQTESFSLKGAGECYSSVGRTGGRQQISIGYGCEDKGIVMHEVGHSLGFWHEQSRPDRDNYIQLKQENIARGTEGNFVKRSAAETDDMGLPYDLGSVMHYGPNAFTIDWDHTTIETIDKNYRRTIGQRSGPSFIDVKQVNRLYCNDRCSDSTLLCQNGGYPDPNNCLTCKCPAGLGGPTCSNVQPSDCGSELTASPFWQHLIYKGVQRCYWRIKNVYKTFRNFFSCSEKDLEIISEQDEMLIIVDARELNREGLFTLSGKFLDSGKPLPRPPPPIWIPGSENRQFRGAGSGGRGGPIERFILNSIPQIRDPSRPVESIASIVTEFTLGQILGATRDH